jgi:hypothetical protein
MLCSVAEQEIVRAKGGDARVRKKKRKREGGWEG